MLGSLENKGITDMTTCQQVIQGAQKYGTEGNRAVIINCTDEWRRGGNGCVGHGAAILLPHHLISQFSSTFQLPPFPFAVVR